MGWGLGLAELGNNALQVLNSVVLAASPLGQFYVQINRLENSKTDRLYNIWNGTRFLLDKNLFPETLNNFEGKVLK